MRLFGLACIFSAMLLLASGCMTKETEPAVQSEAPTTAEQHEVMKPVIPDEQPADTDTTEPAEETDSTSDEP